MLSRLLSQGVHSCSVLLLSVLPRARDRLGESYAGRGLTIAPCPRSAATGHHHFLSHHGLSDLGGCEAVRPCCGSGGGAKWGAAWGSLGWRLILPAMRPACRPGWLGHWHWEAAHGCGELGAILLPPAPARQPPRGPDCAALTTVEGILG